MDVRLLLRACEDDFARDENKEHLYTFIYIYINIYIHTHPPKDGGGLTISGNLKSFEGPVLNCVVSI